MHKYTKYEVSMSNPVPGGGVKTQRGALIREGASIRINMVVIAKIEGKLDIIPSLVYCSNSTC